MKVEKLVVCPHIKMTSPLHRGGGWRTKEMGCSSCWQRMRAGSGGLETPGGKRNDFRTNVPRTFAVAARARGRALVAGPPRALPRPRVLRQLLIQHLADHDGRVDRHLVHGSGAAVDLHRLWRHRYGYGEVSLSHLDYRGYVQTRPAQAVLTGAEAKRLWMGDGVKCASLCCVCGCVCGGVCRVPGAALRIR